ncbi:unnamed protein product [Leptidea sinapis]|uniref:Uncharacterized protein n=1 Tax=Leptidea sinapis TaxID=189913 RepID=A0A5E4QV62_9NEOP|nr:unnamed protein product [Leptidea sinapis]
MLHLSHFSDRSSVVTKCRASDSECMKESAQAILPKFALGLQQFNVETLDPITFDKIVADNPNLKLTLTNFHFILFDFC